uniref:neuroblast differentiation-associated protein AHNAK-like n=1 Tax=Monopterus albus TaxID=43700 RepID=UPI0009B4389A|nr:neuroblast differentiation-associated protein AHNAK-like [Monopterus albus]
MCDCFHLAFPNWQAASSGTGAGRRLRGPEPGTEDESISDEPPAFTEEERPRPQGSSPVEEYPESEKYTDSDKEGATEHDSHHKSGSVKKSKLSGLGSMFEKCSTPKMSKLKEAHSPESGVIVKTAKDGSAEGLIYGGGGKEGLFIKEVVPESPASKSLKLKEGDQVLSATVYFDSMPYEDAVRILGHAHAYRVRLCLKRNQKSTETEPGIDSDTIPEEELDTPEMREQGKTKRHGDARISWPKFPSFGSGQKSRFTRSHSSSEADEQKKLELSPTTSDTESPIKSQDALKGKKRYKTKATVPTKRDHISSPEDQETDAPTTGQSSDDTDHTVDMQETPDVCVAKDLKRVEDSRAEQNDQTLTENVQHKVKISVKSIMKTADLIVPLGDQESPSGIKSPDEKRKNKEKSELKVKILGKDKKDAKTKSSPKRLKTLGASTETEDQSGKYDVFPSLESHKEPKGDQLTLDAEPQIISSESSTIVPQKSVKMSVPKVELDISDVTFLQKSQKKGEEKTRRGKDTKQKQETKTGPTYKQPKVDLSEIATERIIQEKNVNGEECTAKTEQITTEETGAIEDPYDRLSKRSLPKTKLPKREDIEIPGMEDKSMRTKDKVIKEPKTVFTGQNSNEIQAETVQLSIDVDSVKEAVSKLPGYKLPKVDTYGMPIPEEITVIDANAQRISVKTPTKVVDAKTKYETHFTKFDINASPEISKTMVKLPKITPADLTLAEEPLTETKVGLIKTEKDSKTKPKQSDKEIKTEMYKQDNITIPSQKSAQERAILQPQETDQTERTKAIAFDYEPVVKLSQKKSDKKSKEKITMPSVEMAKPDIKIPDIGIDLPKQLVSEQKKDTVKEERIILVPEVKTSKSGPKKTKGQTGEVISDFKMPELESIEYIDSEGGSPANKVDGVRLTSCEVTLDATKSKPEKSIPAIRGEVKDTEAEKHLIKLPRFETVTPDISINVPNAEVITDGAEMKTLERQGKDGTFKMPNLIISMPKEKGPKIDVSLSKKNADYKLPEVHDTDIALRSVDVSIPEQMIVIKKPELQTKSQQIEGELEGQGSKDKMPKTAMKMSNFKGHEFDLNLSTKDSQITLPEAKAEVKPLQAPEADVTLGGVDVSIPEQEMAIEEPELEMKPLQIEGDLHGQGSKVKKPKFAIKMPRIKGPKFDWRTSQKGLDVAPQETKAEVKLPEVQETDFTLGNIPVSIPEQKIYVEKPELESTTTEVRDMGKGIITEGVPAVNTEAPSIKCPSVDIKTTGTEHDEKGSKFRLPSLGFSVPQGKGHDTDSSSTKKDLDVALQETKAEVKLPEVPETDITLGNMPVFIPEQKIYVEKPELEIKPVQIEGDLHGQGSKVKKPKFAIKMPRIKWPEFDVSSSPNNSQITLPEAKAEVKPPQAPEADVTLGGVDVSIPEAEMVIEDPSAEVEAKAPEIKVATKDTKGSPSKWNMPTVKWPKFGGGTPSTTTEVPDMCEGIITEEDPAVNTEAPSIKCPSVDIKTTGTEHDEKGSKFRLPSLGFSVPQGKGQDIDSSSTKKDLDVALQETKAEVKLPCAELKEPLAEVEAKAPEIKVATKDTKGSPSKWNMPTVKWPKFGGGTPSTTTEVPDMCEGIITEEDPAVNTEAPSIKCPSVDIKTTGTEHDEKGSKFRLPNLGFSVPQGKEHDTDSSSTKKDLDVALQETKAEVKLPCAELKDPSAEVEAKAPEIKVATKDTKGSPSKWNMPTVKWPKFGGGTPSTTTEVPDMGKSIITEEVPAVNTEAPSIKCPSVDIKTTGTEHDEKGSKFNLPSLGFSVPQGKGQDIDSSSTKKDLDVAQQETKAEVKLPCAELKEPLAEVEAKAPEIKAVKKDTKGSPSKLNMPTFKLPKFGRLNPQVKVHDVERADLNSPEVKAQVKLPDVELKESATPFSVSQAPPIEGDANLKKTSWTLPKLSFSKPIIKTSEGDVNLDAPKADVPDLSKAALLDSETPKTERDGVGRGSPSKFELRSIQMPDVTFGIPGLEDDSVFLETKSKEANIKQDIKSLERTAMSKPATLDSKTLKTERGGVGRGSPSKFELRPIQMPDVTFSIPGLEDDNVVLETKSKEDQLEKKVEAKEESKSTKSSLMPFGKRLNKTDVEIVDLPETEKKEAIIKQDIKSLERTAMSKPATLDSKTLKTERGGVGRGSPSKFELRPIQMPDVTFSIPGLEDDNVILETKSKENQLEKKVEAKGESKSTKSSLMSFDKLINTIGIEFPDLPETKKKEANKKDTTKSPERTGWFKFPESGLFSKSEPQKVSKKDDHKDKKSPGGEIGLEELSPSSSVQSSDAFADISSPRLESGKMHVIKSNIQVTPEAHHAKILTAVQVQSSGDLPLEPEAKTATSWTVEDSQSGKRTVVEKHLIGEISSEKSETVVTKQIPHRPIVESSEPISGETASSIQRLRDSVHSEKMRFFDGAEK